MLVWSDSNNSEGSPAFLTMSFFGPLVKVPRPVV
jgi:hypothetical protein